MDATRHTEAKGSPAAAPTGAPDPRAVTGARPEAAAGSAAPATASGQAAPAAASGAASGAAPATAERLTAADVSVFCEGMAMMLSAGIQTDEALSLLDIRSGNARLSAVCDIAYRRVLAGEGLASALRATGAFPSYAVGMVEVGERSGRLEQTLRRLMVYYDEESRVFAKIRTAVGYPAALLCVMAVIVAFTVWVVLPVFIQVYEGLAGSLAAGSSASIAASIGIGWAALIITVLGAAAAVAAVVASRTPRGNAMLQRSFERLPITRPIMEKLALSRFTLVLSTYVASGVNDDVALAQSLETVEHPCVREHAQCALQLMRDPDSACGLSAAIAESGLLDALSARMLVVSARTGSVENVLAGLGETFFNDAADGIDRVVDSVEPLLAALLTVAVGATLLAVMLPLIGIMGSIG